MPKQGSAVHSPGIFFFPSIFRSWLLLDEQLSFCVPVCFSRARLFVTPWTVAHQAPLSMGFSRQEYWKGLPFPPPGESSSPRDRTHISCNSLPLSHLQGPQLSFYDHLKNTFQIRQQLLRVLNSLWRKIHKQRLTCLEIKAVRNTVVDMERLTLLGPSNVHGVRLSCCHRV